jgi:hypothetical protein
MHLRTAEGKLNSSLDLVNSGVVNPLYRESYSLHHCREDKLFCHDLITSSNKKRHKLQIVINFKTTSFLNSHKIQLL